jgi:hypothetical protein
MSTYEERREKRRRFLRQNLFWLVPLGMLAGVGLFIGLGFLVAWLWRVTLVDIFAIKPISFWQAWGLILLAQILFKANMRPTMRTGYRRRCAPAGGDAPETQTEPTPGS